MRACRLVLCLALVIGVGLFDAPVHTQEPPPNPQVVIETSEGDITAELFRGDAVVTVVNFLTYVNDGYYDGTIFHRVIRNFMIQGGGFTEDLERKMDGLRGGIINEATNGLKNEKGTLALARTADPNSGSSQFFINTVDNPALDHQDTSAQGYGYAVFGRVIDGMDVVEQIGRASTYNTVTGMNDVPRHAITINQIRRIN